MRVFIEVTWEEVTGNKWLKDGLTSGKPFFSSIDLPEVFISLCKLLDRHDLVEGSTIVQDAMTFA